MVGIKDVTDLIYSLNLADHVYAGLLPDKKEKSIGIYPARLSEDVASMAPSYGIEPITLLIHWNESVVSTEKAAYEVRTALKKIKDYSINENTIKFIRTRAPIPVGADDAGIFEYTIDCLFYYNL